jgi:hypothetical protein
VIFSANLLIAGILHGGDIFTFVANTNYELIKASFKRFVLETALFFSLDFQAVQVSLTL